MGSMWGPIVVAGDPTDPANYGLAPGVASVAQITPNPAVSPSVASGAAVPPWSPSSPLFWVGALLGVTFGAVGFNAHARLLTIRGGVDVGKS